MSDFKIGIDTGHYLQINTSAIALKLGKVLVVDDDTNYTKRIQKNLSLSGYQSECVNSFSEMQRILDAEPKAFPLVFCDNIEGNPKHSKKISGSEILLTRLDWLGNRKFVLVTGWEEKLITGHR